MRVFIYFIVLILFYFFNVNKVLGQCNPVGITTHPDNAVNPEKPAKTNTFDWRETIFDVNSSYIPNPYIVSPFFQDDNVGTLIFADNPDRLPEDGWELVKYRNGYNLDGTIDQTLDGFPYLVLYNKYTGVLRVMTVFDQTVPYTGVTIKIRFDSLGSEKQTSLLSNASKIFALDQYEAAPEINAAMEYNNNAARWFFADFQMTYDPCTCLFESTLRIEVELIEQSSIELTGSLEGTLTSIDNKAGNVSQKAQGYSFKELGSAAIPAIQKAQKTYASANKFVTTQFEALDTEGKTEAQLIAEGKLKLANKVRSLNQFQALLKKSDFLQQGLKAVPYIGAAVELVDFFVSGGKKSSSAQEVKIMPMSIQADMNLEGYITTSYLFPDITINTPGSENVAIRNDSDYPLYNEVLGVFNLLETPVAYYKEEEYYYEEPYVTEEEYLATYQLQDLKYVVNPAAGFNLAKSEMLVSLEFDQFATDYIPVSAVGSFSVFSGFHDINGQISQIGCADGAPLKSIKVILNLVRNDATPNTQNVLMVLRYPVTLVKNQSYNYNPNYCSWQDDLSFQNQTISGTHKAWGHITIGQGTIMQPGTVIQAGSITVEKGVTIPQGVTLKLGLPTGAIDTGIATASAETVSAFCNGTTYNDPLRTVFRIGGDSSRPEPVIIEKVETFRVYPNPTQGVFTLNFGAKPVNKVEVTIVNSTGGLVHNVILENTTSTTIDLSSMPKGLYLLKVKNAVLNETRKIILK